MAQGKSKMFAWVSEALTYHPLHFQRWIPKPSRSKEPILLEWHWPCVLYHLRSPDCRGHCRERLSLTSRALSNSKSGWTEINYTEIPFILSREPSKEMPPIWASLFGIQSAVTQVTSSGLTERHENDRVGIITLRGRNRGSDRLYYISLVIGNSSVFWLPDPHSFYPWSSLLSHPGQEDELDCSNTTPALTA